MVSAGHRLDALIIINHTDLSFICVCECVGWLDRKLDILSSVEHYLLALDFEQIICWNEATIWLLNDATEDIRDVKVYLVALFELLSVTVDCADGVMRSFEQALFPICFLLVRIVPIVAIELSSLASIDIREPARFIPTNIRFRNSWRHRSCQRILTLS